MTTSPQTSSTYEFVTKKVTPKTFKKFSEMTEDEQILWIKYSTRWHWPAIAALMETSGATSSIRELAYKLRLDVRDALDAVEGLEEMGIIRRLPNSKFERLVKNIDLDLEEIGVPKNDILRGSILVATEVVSHLTNVKNSEHLYLIVASNRALVKEHIDRVRSSFEKLLDDSRYANNEEVFGFTFNGTSFCPPDGTNRFGNKRRPMKEIELEEDHL